MFRNFLLDVIKDSTDFNAESEQNSLMLQDVEATNAG